MELRDFIITLQNATDIQNKKNKLQILPKKGEAIILGDIHGDLKTLELILSKEV